MKRGLHGKGITWRGEKGHTWKGDIYGEETTWRRARVYTKREQKPAIQQSDSNLSFLSDFNTMGNDK